MRQAAKVIAPPAAVGITGSPPKTEAAINRFPARNGFDSAVKCYMDVFDAGAAQVFAILIMQSIMFEVSRNFWGIPSVWLPASWNRRIQG